ncbi:MAG: OLD family endonuclease, partial [Candidatus Krumholzibacteria bacterium]|nr:OLD family endonuclease [Candidatus Krumholzibacteria bacterium]
RAGSADFLSLVGENNTAKSSVLEVLILALPTTGQTKPTLDHFRDRREENGPIEVEFHFNDLTEHDEAEQGIRTHVFEGEYKVKKVWASANSAATIWAFEPVHEIPTWPDPDTSMASFRDGGVDWTNLLDAYKQEFGEVPARVSKEFRENLCELAVTSNSPLVVEGEATWVKNPGGFSAHVDSILPQPIHIPAIKETKEEADVAQKKSAIRQIVEAMFERELAANPAVELFTQAGEDVKQLFAGEEGDEIVRRIESRIGDGIKRFIDLDASLEFEPPDINAELASKTPLQLMSQSHS